MVDVLFRDGQPQAALLLEEQWNQLTADYPFTLLCAYALGSFRTEADAQAFREVCAAHSHVVPTERYSESESGDARMREVCALQQRAVALEGEIEHRKRVERELVEALALREDFLSIAGHELKTPLTALQLQIHSLTSLATQLGDERYLPKLERSRRQVERLAKLTDELLDVSRLTAGRLSLHVEECDLAAIVMDALDRNAEAIARSGCRLRVLAEEPAPGRWDRGRVEQVVTNLLTNALKYGAGKPVEILLKRIKERWRLTVRDQGVGVALADQARIFDRFERANSSRNFGGLGLGLWITRQVVEAHGGVIRVESEEGAGATFTVEFPALPFAAAPGA
jgi:signal transduction histidine kinase